MAEKELLPVEDNPAGWMARLRRFKVRPSFEGAACWYITVIWLQGNYKMLKDATDDKSRINIIGVVRSVKPPRLSTKSGQ